jgi:CRP-like cAMP-binding protein
MASARVRIEAILRSAPLFSNLEDRAISRVSRGASLTEVSRGTVIFRQGDPDGSLYLVALGQVKLALQDGAGEEKVIELAGPGSILGMAALFLGTPYLATAEAVTAARVVSLPKERILDEIGNNPDFALGVVRELSRRLYRRTRDLEACMLHSGTERVVGYLLELAGDAVRTGEATVVLPAQKSVIASRLNLTHEHFSRILHALGAAGLIAVAGREVRILEPLRLQEYGDSRVRSLGGLSAPRYR